MFTYTFLQEYWWCLVSLFGALVVMLMFVQGGNTHIFTLGKTEEERSLIINSTGRKWEYTFTTLVVFGGAFFASFPLFYSTSFSGAYWVWMIILFSFVVQAVSYEFQSKCGNFLGKTTYRCFLIANGIIGPLFLGTAVSTFFHGANFVVNKDVMGEQLAPAISQWTSAWRGLEAIANPWNLCLGLVVFFLARTLGLLYFINNIEDAEFIPRVRRALFPNAALFLLFFLPFTYHLFTMQGWAVNPHTQAISLVSGKYFQNMLDMPLILLMFVVGVSGVLVGILWSLLSDTFVRGIWFSGLGTILTVWAILLIAGLNNTAFYPSLVDAQSSLTLANSASSEFTLKVMSIVSLIAPFVLAYMVHAWYSIDQKSLTKEELEHEDHKY